MTTPDTQSEGERLAEELKQENELHEQNKQEEEERHEQRVNEIREEGGIDTLVERAEKVKDLSSQIKDMRNEIKETYFKAINQMTTRQRVSVLEKITVRDNSVYKYDNTDEATVKMLFNRPAILESLKREIDENQHEEFDEAKAVLSRMDMDYSSYSPVEFSAVAENDDNYIRFESSSTRKFFIYPKDEYTKEEAEKGKNSYTLDEYLTTSTPSKMKKILRNKDEIRDTIEDVRQQALDELQTREEIHKELQGIMKKQMMMGGLVE